MNEGRRRFSGPGRALGTTALVAVLGLAGLPAPAEAAAPAGSSAALADWNGGYGGRWGAERLPWGYSDDSQTTTQTSDVQSTPATEAESTGVVLIDTQLSYEGAQGAGTGIVLTAGGEVLTNYHVVEGATTIDVTVAATGRTYSATVLGRSETADVALLQLTGASGLSTATLDRGSVALGDRVTAVGNAGGTGSLTAARGTVTDLSSSITTASEGSADSEHLRGLIETDADVVAGDSGGPLLDAQGEVVGIDTAASDGSSSSTIDGYAVPIADALAVVQQIRSGTETSTVEIGAKAFLGVQVSDSPTGYPDAGGSPDSGGATVAGVVDGSPAATAGLSAGDTITAVGSTEVSSADEVRAALAPHAVGDQVGVSWTDSSGASRQAEVTLTASPTA